MRKANPNWRKIRALVISRAGGTCQVCHSRPATEVTHRVKRRFPRPPARYDLDNMLAVCQPCHKLYDAKRDGRR